MKQLLPYEDYELRSILSMQEMTRRLRMQTEAEEFIRIKFFGVGRDRPYEGQIYDSNFKIKRILGYNNSFRPVITGNIEREFNTTVVHVKMNISVFAYIIWVVSVFLIGIIAFVAKIDNMQDGGLPLILFFAVCIVPVVAFKIESYKSRKFLRELFEATELGERLY